MIGEYLGRKKLQYSLRANKCYYVRSVFQLAIFSIHATKAPSLRPLCPPPLLSSARDNFSRWIQLLSRRTDLIATVDTTKRCTRSNKWEMEKWRIVTLHLLPSSLSSRIVTWENSIDRNKQFSETRQLWSNLLEKTREERGNSIAKTKTKLSPSYKYIFSWNFFSFKNFRNFFFFTFRSTLSDLRRRRNKKISTKMMVRRKFFKLIQD